MNEVEFLKLVAKTLQRNYPSQAEARNAITVLLEETDNRHMALTGKKIVRRKNVLESIAGL